VPPRVTICSGRLYAYTYLGLEMPTIDEAFRVRVRQLRPQRVVLLCMEPTCRNAGAALENAGYHVNVTAQTRLHAGGTSVWARVYALSGEIP
jgi:hypothetical protein